jgi:coenzyme F420-0:L-glutamate ligase / coenzyme F420-1:gamma-L-glutamate ligase
MKRIEIFGLDGIGEVGAGDSIGRLIVDACSRNNVVLEPDDVLVIAQKIVSKSEGRLLRLGDVMVSDYARELSRELDKDPALIQLILGESRRIVRKGGRAMIVETHHGFICANAGVDCSNVGLGKAALLPKNPDASARRIRAEIQELVGASPATIISDSFGRAWRVGTADVAVGISGIKPIKDERGTKDRYGYELRAAVAAIADEIASAAELVMRKKEGVPVVVVRGCEIEKEEGSVKDLLRPEAEDLFR